MRDLSQWNGCKTPEAPVLEGRFVRLERLSGARHGDGLFAACTMEDADDRFRWLPEYPPENRQAFQPWLDAAEASTDPLYYTVIDKASGKVAGRQTFLRIDPKNGVIELGHILWSSIIARKPAATEAFYLFARYIFDDLGYRRFEWKCNNANAPSKRAAERFGMTFEGIFRQAAVVKGENRDTAWFSLIDGEWPLARAAFEAWLAPQNFDENGNQRVSLSALNARRHEAEGVLFNRVGVEAQALVEALQADAYARIQAAVGSTPVPLMWDYAEILAGCEVWICERDREPAGALILRRRPGDLYVESVATVDKATGTGLGNAMMTTAFDRARAIGATRIRLMTNAENPALAWYKRLGFEIEREENLADRTVVHMMTRVS
jgi:RimJ/RimL family protein N-acetyltransferase